MFNNFPLLWDCKYTLYFVISQQSMNFFIFFFNYQHICSNYYILNGYLLQQTAKIEPKHQIDRLFEVAIEPPKKLAIPYQRILRLKDLVSLVGKLHQTRV